MSEQDTEETPIPEAELPAKQEVAITYLLLYPTIKEAAKQAGVGERTLYRWCAEDEAFRTRYASARRLLLDQAVGNLQKFAGYAVQALANIMTDKDAPASSRVSAARSILELTFKGTELLDLDTRLAALEAAQEGIV